MGVASSASQESSVVGAVWTEKVSELSLYSSLTIAADVCEVSGRNLSIVKRI